MSVRIGLGITSFPFDDADGFWRWVDLCEESDVDSIWQSDRLVSKDPQLEPMSVMAALAGRTRRLKFGMSVVVLSFRDPLVLAKECATIDYLSNGRLLPAFGIGPQQAPEWAVAGLSTKERGRRADEMLELMTRLWSEEKVTYQGEHFRYEGATIAPRPVQSPLPLWIGGSSQAAIRRTARLGTGWLGGIQGSKEIAGTVAAIRAAVVAEGRTIDDDHYGASFSFRFGRRNDPAVERAASALARFAPNLDVREYLVVGGAAEMIAQAERLQEAGVSKFVLRPIAAGTAEVLEQTRRLIAEVIPHVHGRPVVTG